MTAEQIQFDETPSMTGARMILSFTGWMDGGDVSTGSVEYLAQAFEAREVASIRPDDFYIYNFPGSMEVSSLFRPHAVISEGLVVDYAEPVNVFSCNEEHKLVFFEGKEPNMNWRAFGDCIFTAAKRFGVEQAVFVGSVAGAVPHTREPRFFSSVSRESLRTLAEEHGLFMSDYEGPASFITYMLLRAEQHGVELMTLVSEIPAYLEGRNLKCIAAVVRKLSDLLSVPVPLAELNAMTSAFEKRLATIVEERPELAEFLHKFEQTYDQEVQDSQMDDIRSWFEKQNIRLD